MSSRNIIFGLLAFLYSSSLLAIPKIYTPAVEDMAKNYFSFSLYKDEFVYSDPNSMFTRTFREGDHSSTPFVLLFQFDYPLVNSWVDIGWEMNFGFGYNTGRGRFSGDQSESETILNLWTLPLETGLFLELDLKYLIVSISGGPSVLGVIQNRSDFAEDESGKNIRQFGYGYYYIGRVKLNLNRIFKRNAFKLFSSYQATRLTMNFEVRHVDYDHFKDNIKIAGDSYGIGFSFDFY